jgi:hypothetical protein
MDGGRDATDGVGGSLAEGARSWTKARDGLLAGAILMGWVGMGWVGMGWPDTLGLGWVGLGWFALGWGSGGAVGSAKRCL